jgi:hypothetical protein
MAVKNTIGMQNNTARHLVLSAHPAGRPWHLKPAVWSPNANHPAAIMIVYLIKNATIKRRREALGLLCWIKWSLFKSRRPTNCACFWGSTSFSTLKQKL